MAEAAAAVYAAHEVVSTTAQLGVGAYYISKPTVPLKATFTQIASSSDDSTKLSLTRSDHTISIRANKAYIFGGRTASNKLASTDVHAITLVHDEKTEADYSIIPPVADEPNGDLPAPRAKHAACAFNVCIAIYGGVDEVNTTLDESSTIWLFNTAKPAWEKLAPTDNTTGPRPRYGAKLFDHENNLILFGGYSSDHTPLKDVWHFDYAYKKWKPLPEAPTSSTDAAIANGILHIISSSDDNMGGSISLLPLNEPKDSPQKWHTVPFPTNPLTPGPQPRTGAGLMPVTTGYGRHYLLYLFGEAPSTPPSTSANNQQEAMTTTSTTSPPLYHSDLWTYQLPSTPASLSTATSSSLAATGSKIKDSIRHALGFDTGEHSWAEAEVLAPADIEGSAGKVHPGPRGHFACDVMGDGKSVVMWGGVNAKGEVEGDGWVIKLE